MSRERKFLVGIHEGATAPCGGSGWGSGVTRTPSHRGPTRSKFDKGLRRGELLAHDVFILWVSMRDT